MRSWSAVLIALTLAAPTEATTYEVGPALALTELSQVPWHQLAAGDLVLIHWRSTPYRTKWVLNRRGTASQPIVVRGVRGPLGQRPVVSGDGATTPSPLNFWNEARGVIKVGGSNTPPDDLPAYLVIEGLEVRSAHPSYSFTDDGGSAGVYATNAAAIYVEKAEHLVIRDCDIHDSGNGLFVAAFDGDTQDILIEGNFIHGNGIDGSAFEHNTYTAARGIVYQANRFGALRSGANGNNLKDRSAGLVVRSNWIEGGNRQLDLVDAEDSINIVNDPRYHQTFVYGNVLIEPDGAGNSQIVHYGGDSGDTSIYRKGTLFFYNNTLVSSRAGNTTLLRLSSDEETADVRNNILYVTATGNRLAMLDADGVLNLTHNWLKPGWVASHSGLSGTLNDDGTSVEGAAPGFVNSGAQDFHLDATAPAANAGTALAPAVLPNHNLAWQYLVHQALEPRAPEGVIDLGAFERCALAGCGVIFRDGFESGSTAAWAVVQP